MLNSPIEVVRPELTSEEELHDALPQYTGHLAPSLQQALAQQVLDEVKTRSVTKGELPALISALILRLFRPENASEGDKRDSGGDHSSTHSAPQAQPSSSGYCLAHSLSSSPRSFHEGVSPQQLAWHHRSSSRSSSDFLHPTAPAAGATAANLPYPRSAIPAQVGPYIRDSPRSSLRRARVTAIQEAILKRGSTDHRQQQEQQQEQLEQGSPKAPPSPKMNAADSLRRSRSFVEVMKTASAANSASSNGGGVSNTLEGTRGHHRSNGSSGFNPSTTGNSTAPRAKPHFPVHARTCGPDELPFKVPHPTQPQSSFVLAHPRTQASNTAAHSPPTPLPPIRTPLATAQTASATPTPSSCSPESWRSSSHLAMPSRPMTRSPSPHHPQFPAAATSVAATKATSSGLVSALSGSLDQGGLDEFKGLGLRNSQHGSELNSPFRLATASSIKGSSGEEEGRQRAGRKGVVFVTQASDGSGTSRDSLGRQPRTAPDSPISQQPITSPGTSPTPSSAPLSPSSTPPHSRRSSALKGRSSVDDRQGRGEGDSKPLRRSVSFAVPQSASDGDHDDSDDEADDGHAGPHRPLSSRNRSKPLGRVSRQRRHQRGSCSREGLEQEGDRGHRRHCRRAHRASDTGFAQDQCPRQMEVERSSRDKDASHHSLRHSTPNKQGQLQQVLPTRTEHDISSASTVAAATGVADDGAIGQQPGSTAASSRRKGIKDARGGDASGTSQLDSERGESDDSSNSEEDVSKAVAKLLRKRYPTLALPLLQVLESRCRPEDLLMLVAAPAKSQQHSLDTTVQGALMSLMGENLELRSRVRELESLTHSSNSSNSSSAFGRSMLPANQGRSWAKTRSLGRDIPTSPHFRGPANFSLNSAGPGSAGGSGAANSSLCSRSLSDHSSEAFSELTLRPLQLKRSARTTSTRSSSHSHSQSLYSNRSLYNRWSSSVRSSVRSRSSARSRATTTSGSKQEEEDHHGPDMERLGYDEIAAVAAASLRARGSIPLENLVQGHSRVDECSHKGRRSSPVPKSEMTPYGLQALHERLSSASGSNNGNEGGTAGSARSSKQQHSEIQESAAANMRGVQEIEEEETPCEELTQLMQQQHRPKEEQAVQDHRQGAKQPENTIQGAAGEPQCCAIQ